MENGIGLDKDFDHHLPSMVSAYKMCFAAEKQILDQLNEDPTDVQRSELRKMLKNIRVLGHLLAHCPSDAGKEHIRETIFSPDYRTENRDDSKPWLDIGTTTVEMLVQQGQFYDTFLIRPC